MICSIKSLDRFKNLKIFLTLSESNEINGTKYTKFKLVVKPGFKPFGPLGNMSGVGDVAGCSRLRLVEDKTMDLVTPYMILLLDSHDQISDNQLAGLYN